MKPIDSFLKGLGILLPCLIFFTRVHSQSVTAKSYLDSIFVDMLVRDQVLLSDEDKEKKKFDNHWHNNKTKKEYIKNDLELKSILLKTYFSPTLTTSDLVSEKLLFPNKTIGFLGSMIIRNDDLSILNSPKIPILPVLISLDQLSLLNPDASNYKLNMNTKSVFDKNAEINAKLVTNPVIQAQAAASTFRNENSSQNISVGVGTYKNQLATVFENMLLKNFAPKDFIPLYYVWNLMLNKDIIEGDKCIKSFRGVSYSLAREQNFSSEIKFDASMDAKGSFPIISLGGNSIVEWSRINENSAKSNKYSVIMFQSPELIKFPTIDQIKKQWQDIVRRLNFKNDPPSTIFPYNGDLTFNVVFGPIPGDDVASNNIVLDKQYTFKSFPTGKVMVGDIDINLDPKNVKPLGDNLYSFQVTLKGNKDFFSTAGPKSLLNLEIPIRLYLNNPIGNDTLDIKYAPFTISTECTPIPFLSDDIKLVSNGKTSTTYSFSQKISIETPTIGKFVLATSASSRPQISDIGNIPDSKKDLKAKFLLNSHIKTDADPTSFTLEFEIDSSSFYDFFPNTTALNLQVQFKDQNNPAVIYNKPLTLNILIPDEVAKAHLQKPIGTISFNTNDELLKAVDTSLKVKLIGDSTIRSLGSIISIASTPNSGISSMKLIDIIKGYTDLILSPENKYLISTKFLKKEGGVQ